VVCETPNGATGEARPLKRAVKKSQIALDLKDEIHYNIVVENNTTQATEVREMVDDARWNRYCDLCCTVELTPEQQEEHQDIEHDVSCDECGLPTITVEQASKLEEMLSAVNIRPAYVDRCTCPKHDSPCGRMHLVANLYNDPAGLSDTMCGLTDLKKWPLWWIDAENVGLANCFALVFHDPGVTREEAEAFVRHEYDRGKLRPEWYGNLTDEQEQEYYERGMEI
jgi:hypothetical protein